MPCPVRKIPVRRGSMHEQFCNLPLPELTELLGRHVQQRRGVSCCPACDNAAGRERSDSNSVSLDRCLGFEEGSLERCVCVCVLPLCVCVCVCVWILGLAVAWPRSVAACGSTRAMLRGERGSGVEVQLRLYSYNASCPGQSLQPQMLHQRYAFPEQPKSLFLPTIVVSHTSLRTSADTVGRK